MELEPDGSFTYTPDESFAGSDNFTYTIGQGALQSEPALVFLIAGNPCPAAALYGEDSMQALLLRRYRDEVLRQTAAGQLAVRLYYALAPWTGGLLDDSPLLQDASRRLIDCLLPMIERQVED